MAAEEGLIFSKRDTDGVFEQICRTPVDYRIRQQLLEQVVLTPTIALNRWHAFLWDAISGPLKEDGHIINLNDPIIDSPCQIEGLSLYMIAGLTRAAGHEIPVSEIEARAHAVQIALQEEENFTIRTGRKAPNLMEKQIRNFLNEASFLEIPHDYSEHEYEEQRQRNEKYSEFSPIANALSEYMAVSELATKHNMLIKMAYFPEFGQQQLLNPNFLREPSSEELVLFRIVSNELGKTTFRPTIKDCLKLAQDPATIALREHLVKWHAELASGEESTLQSIKAEIQTASAALSKLRGVQTAGSITTWLSVPVSVVELIFSLPPLLSISVGIAGKMCSAGSAATKKKYRWAMYGSSPC